MPRAKCLLNDGDSVAFEDVQVQKCAVRIVSDKNALAGCYRKVKLFMFQSIYSLTFVQLTYIASDSIQSVMQALSGCPEGEKTKLKENGFFSM